ncbi:MAG: hypothetical protein BWY74_03921 [Firmicutes bacterium ADurb.Bin419]|nr:MAG: hypothetical protein BWY74_03921 [Firmicutes bacterium ADurb.Bin419]
MNYEYFDAVLGKRESKKLRYQTWAKRDGDIIYIQHFETPILQFFKNGKVIYSTEGWRTKTTKDRLNAYGPLNIYSNSGLWWVGDYGDPMGVYKDGMIYHKGKLYNTATKNEINRYNKLKKASLKYTRDFINAALNGELSSDLRGDCFYCQAGIFEQGRTSHVISHIKENYFVPSMLYHGLNIAGAGPYIYLMVKEALDGTIQEYNKSTAAFYMKSALRRVVNQAVLATL